MEKVITANLIHAFAVVPVIGAAACILGVVCIVLMLKALFAPDSAYSTIDSKTGPHVHS